MGSTVVCALVRGTQAVVGYMGDSRAYRLGAGRRDQVLVTNDGRALQEQLGRTTPGRWSVIGLPDVVSQAEERR